MPRPTPSPHLLPFRTGWDYLLFWGGAVLIALCAIVFALSCRVANGVFMHLVHLAPWLSVVLPPAGFAGVAWLTRYVFIGSEGSGIPQTIAALDQPVIANRKSVLALRAAGAKILLTLLGLCVGASVGPEGPTILVGAAIMHAMGRHFQLKGRPAQRSVLIAGGAAGIAAAFNAPLAGVLFAIEGLSKSIDFRSSAKSITGVVIAGFVSAVFFEQSAYFGRAFAIQIPFQTALIPILVCGIVGGLGGGFLAWLLLRWMSGVPGRIGELVHAYPVAFAALCGLAMALLGTFCCPHIFGTGYEETKGLLEGTAAPPATFGIFKLLATALTNLCGMPGGLFASSLAIGAGLGANVAALFPGIPVACVVLLGMVGFFSGVIQTPITATVIVMEMTDDPNMTLPLLSTALLAWWISRLIVARPLYPSLALLFLKKQKRNGPRALRTADA